MDLESGGAAIQGSVAADVVNALSVQNLILPAGTAKIGSFEYQVDMNGSDETVEELNDMPVKSIGSSTIFMQDVAYVRDGFRATDQYRAVDGQRAALMVI